MQKGPDPRPKKSSSADFFNGLRRLIDRFDTLDFDRLNGHVVSSGSHRCDFVQNIKAGGQMPKGGIFPV